MRMFPPRKIPKQNRVLTSVCISQAMLAILREYVFECVTFKLTARPAAEASGLL